MLRYCWWWASSQNLLRQNIPIHDTIQVFWTFFYWIWGFGHTFLSFLYISTQPFWHLPSCSSGGMGRLSPCASSCWHHGMGKLNRHAGKLVSWGPFYWHGLISTPAWISNHTPSKVLDTITNPFPNFNGSSVEVWEWISNLILHTVLWCMSLLVHARIKAKSKGYLLASL